MGESKGFHFEINLYYYKLKVLTMFGGNKKEKLEKKYQKLMQEAYELSHSNRAKSDQKTAEAEEIRKKIDALTSK
ncbi:MAG: Lacal_2735 family protein [Planctomycetota bacterium]